MGQAKRRKQQDPTYGKTIELDASELPLDEFKDCVKTVGDQFAFNRMKAEGFVVHVVAKEGVAVTFPDAPNLPLYQKYAAWRKLHKTRGIPCS